MGILGADGSAANDEPRSQPPPPPFPRGVTFGARRSVVKKHSVFVSDGPLWHRDRRRGSFRAECPRPSRI